MGGRLLVLVLLGVIYALLFLGVPVALIGAALRPLPLAPRTSWTAAELRWRPAPARRRLALAAAAVMVAAELTLVLAMGGISFVPFAIALVVPALLQWLFVGLGRRSPSQVRIGAGQIGLDRERRSLADLVDARVEEHGFGPWRCVTLRLIFPEVEVEIAADADRPEDLDEVLAALRAGAGRAAPTVEQAPEALVALLARRTTA